MLRIETQDAVIIMMPWKWRELSPMPNLYSHAAAVSYITFYPCNIPKPALIKNYAKVFTIIN